MTGAHHAPPIVPAVDPRPPATEVAPEVSDPPARPPVAQASGWQLGRAGWVIVGVGVGLRLLWSVWGTRKPEIVADPLIYYQAAQRIADGDGYVSFFGEPTSYYPPGYPYFLGTLQWFLDLVGLDGSTYEAAAIVQSLLSGLAIAAIVVVGTRLDGRRTGLFAGAVFALWPNLIIHSSLLLSETLYLTLLSLSLAGTVTMFDAEGGLRRWHAALAGLTLGGATLVRPQVLVVPVAMVVTYALCRVGARQVLRLAAVLAVGVVVVVAPWTIRNAVVFGAFVPVSTNDGDNLCVGFNPDATGAFGIPSGCDTGEFYTDGPEAELRRQSETRERAIEWALEHPGELPELTWQKLFWTYKSDEDALWASLSFGRDPWLSDGSRRVIAAVGNTYYVVVMGLALAGAVLAARRGWHIRRAEPLPLALVAATVASSLVPVLFFGDGRFKVPSTPFYALLAGLALASLARRTRR